jgi:hypothetical protein
MADLLMFYEKECVNCFKMMFFVEKLEKEIGVKIEKIEIWNNPRNKLMYHKINQENIDRVPFFYNQKTRKALSGVSSFDKLKKWAVG